MNGFANIKQRIDQNGVAGGWMMFKKLQ